MKKMLIFTFIGIIGIVMIVKIYTSTGNGKNGDYQLAAITRGDLVNTVSSSGTIKALSTVEVGTQVSGIIDRLFVDFNDQVKKGQLLAVLDTVVLRTSVLDAQANMEKALAQLEEAVADQQRNEPLYQKGLISEAEYLPLKIKVKTQQAALKSAQVALKRTMQNLEYAFIKSPIDGTIIERNVEEGQTCAASFQAPVLFMIAEDLSKMEIHAQVDESDIGYIKKGQHVQFDVQAYPDKIFTGTVKQVRLQPTTVQNVVNYTVVIDAQNDDRFLLPGMTATIDFLVEEKRDVLLVPNTALKFQPSQEKMKAFFQSQRKQFESMPDSARFPGGGPHPRPDLAGQVEPPDPAQMPKDLGHSWYLDKNNNLAMGMLQTGSTDGKMTEILRSRELKEGMQVITGTQSATTTESQKNNSRKGFGGPPPF